MPRDGSLKHIARVVVIAAISVALELILSSTLRSGVQNSRVNEPKAPVASPVQTPTISISISPPPAQPPPATNVTQLETIRFPQLGLVRVSAHQEPGESPKLVFEDADTKKQILTEYLSGYGAATNPNSKLRFKSASIKGLPNPLILAVLVDPGGSDSTWEAAAIGVVNGRLERLTYERLETSDDGGFYFGDLGKGLGLGAAQWGFIWGEGEAHPPPHHYEVKLFKWNGWRFEWHKVFRMRQRFNSARAAIKGSGFRFHDLRKEFPEFSDVEEW